MIAKSFSPYFNRPDISLRRVDSIFVGHVLCMSNLKLIFQKFFVMLSSLSPLCVLAPMKESKQASKSDGMFTSNLRIAPILGVIYCYSHMIQVCLLPSCRLHSSVQKQVDCVWNTSVFIALLFSIQVYKKVVFDIVIYISDMFAYYFKINVKVKLNTLLYTVFCEVRSQVTLVIYVHKGSILPH